MKQYKVRAMADTVNNHRIGTTQGHGGRYNRYDGMNMLSLLVLAVCYSAKYVKEYIEGAKPIFSVGDSCNYNGHRLDYNQGSDREAAQGEFWHLRDKQGKPLGVMGWWPSKAVTFIDNHDTGSTQGYAYILTHPGIPAVFYDHMYDSRNSTHDQIVKLIDMRKRQDIHGRSPIRILEAQPNLYAAVIGENVSMKIRDGSWCPAGREWTLATSGHGYAVWHK